MRKNVNKQALTAKNIHKFITEVGMLKRVVRSGWSVLGIKNAESVAEHSFRCAVIGYVLAHLEKARVYKVLLMTLFNDLAEARITDLHKMAQRYINIDSAEDRAFCQQAGYLPRKLELELVKIRKEYRKQKTIESIIARDADILECLIQAREYFQHGFSQARHFMKKAPAFLKTKSAKKLWKTAKNTDISNWWFKLGEFRR
ncbi:MAG: HAD family hydrolase [Candidatus Omnitrophota bacterium]|nr:MAG: HAD family hydrolase [Candidatus Omnitrophota bacterium]